MVSSTQLYLQKPQAELGSQTCADLIIEYLELLQVEYVFGVPGGAIEPFYNALARSSRRGTVRPIVARHECGAAFMAEGYFYHTGKLAVCCATTGPGITNMLTGIVSAYANYIPMLVISAQTALPTFGKSAVQESSCTSIDINAMLKPCCRYNTLVSHADQLETKLVTAITTAFNPTPGPVHISVPMDIMDSLVKDKTPAFNINGLTQRQRFPSDHTINQLFETLTQSKNMVFIIGDGCQKAIDTIMVVAELLAIKVVSTYSGKGLINSYHPLYRGVLGFAGHDEAMATVDNPSVDTIVCIGTMMGQFATNSWDPRILVPGKIVHVDDNEDNFLTTPMAREHIGGCLLTLFDRVASRLSKVLNSPQEINAINGPKNAKKLHYTLDDEVGFRSDSFPIKPQRLMRELPKIFPHNTRYLADTGNSFAWAVHYLNLDNQIMHDFQPSHSGLLRTGLEFYVMGWAIGCAIGTALALEGQPVVCITGDGSVLMSGQELSVAVQEKLPIAFIILNDSALGMVKHGQRLTGAEAIGFEIPVTDFVTLAASMGARGYRVESVEDLKRLKNITNELSQGPVVVDVLIDTEEVPPIGKRVAMLKGASNLESVQ